MSELLKLLDGSIDEVKAGLAGKSHDDLLKLKAAEEDGKTRAGVLDALSKAIATADADRAGGRVQGGPAAIAADLDNSGAANIAPASEINTSGAPQQIVPDVDMSHPAVDADPRANTTADQNRIDFNDPTISGREAVERSLANN
ncbi:MULTISPECIES: hypothetical protein [unclassified Sphingobium]|uniref:hypothetical protein n=1 Tax=unclassified Sphingobium TaxID=2611147 RepID=UPI0022240849|nr:MULTISPECIES: hypothetical protein [unclassified Sphingobium]MCW2395884.1 hypothetical protein [Sphingobium sp. B8D3B]MCW2419400.1 hypothetical protein [Sphingobium sp. B8D3C]